MIHYVLLIATAVVLLTAAGLAFYYTRDPFHPQIVMSPMFGTLYVYLPYAALADKQVFRFLSPEQMQYTQVLFLCGLVSFSVGWLHASLKTIAKLRVFQLPESARERMMIGACILGALSLAAWFTTIANVGGFVAAYSRSYGEGNSEYGYVRDAVYLSLPALVLLMTSRLGVKLRIRDAVLVALFAAPFTIHGFLGARRSPIFMSAVAIGFGWYMIRLKRPRLIVVLLSGAAVGLLMLFLVSNRDNIYLGSDWQLDKNPTQYLELSTGNEFLYGSAAVIHSDRYDRHYWGRRYFATIFIRPIPSQLWPTKYEDVGVGEIRRNSGLGSVEFRSSVGWAGATGAAPGFISDLYVEFAWLCLVATYGFGWVYGRTWWLAVTRGGFPAVLYVIIAALSLFLVMQSVGAMLVRALWMAIPSGVVWHWAMSKRVVSGQLLIRHLPPSQRRGSLNPHVPSRPAESIATHVRPVSKFPGN